MTPHYDIPWLSERFENGEPLVFLYFWGHTDKRNEKVGKFCFSQWFESPFTVNNITYKTSEHWMMAHKALLFNDLHNFEKIINSRTPGEAKDLGRQVTGYDDQIWNSKRFGIVKAGNIHKFNQNPVFARYLLQTGDKILVEASPVDPIWGIGLTKDSKNIDDIYTWRGLNLLGFALMETRDFLNTFGHFEALKDPMQAPWQNFPALVQADTFWMNTEGKTYLEQFDAYFSALSDLYKLIYQMTNLEPYGWEGFYTK
jgi:ribA/ribD-fused uncharacterized protein